MRTLQLVRDTVYMIQHQIDPGTAIALTADGPLFQRLAAVIEQTDMQKHRKMTILGSYLLLQQAAAKHQGLLERRHDALTRGILDGDYLMGLFYRLLSQNQELRLIQQLSPIYKQMQLSLLLGRPAKPAMRKVYAAFRAYIVQTESEASVL